MGFWKAIKALFSKKVVRGVLAIGSTILTAYCIVTGNPNTDKSLMLTSAAWAYYFMDEAYSRKK